MVWNSPQNIWENFHVMRMDEIQLESCVLRYHLWLRCRRLLMKIGWVWWWRCWRMIWKGATVKNNLQEVHSMYVSKSSRCLKVLWDSSSQSEKFILKRRTFLLSVVSDDDYNTRGEREKWETCCMRIRVRTDGGVKFPLHIRQSSRATQVNRVNCSQLSL